MDRTVLSPSAEFDPSKPTPSNPSPFPAPQIRSVALSSSLPNSQPLVYAGTTSGTLFLLPASTAADPKPPDTSPIAFLDAIRSVSVGNSPVDDVLVLPEIDRVLVLSNGVVSVFDRGLLRSGQSLGEVKRVAVVAKRLRFGDSASADPLGDVDKWSDAMKTRQRFLQRLGRANGSRTRRVESQRDGEGGGCCFVAAAVVGKGLVLMELFLDNSLEGVVSVIPKEVQGVEGAKTMVWFDDSIIVGMSEGYVLFSTRSGQITPIFSLPESSGPPRLQPLCRSKEVLLLMDNVGIVTNVHGQPVGGSLIFRSVPDSVVEMSQYVVTLEDGCLKLYRKKAGNCVQTISVSKSRSGPCVMASVEWGNGEIIAVATPHKITCFHKIYAEDQIKDLLRKKYFKEAVCLMEEFESEGEMSKEMLSFVHAQVGFLLLYDLHFEDAVKHFLLSDTMQPSEIFPFIMRDPNRWSSLVPRNRYWGLHPPPMLLEQVVDEGLTAIQRALFLKKAGVDTAIDEDYVSNPPNRADLLESAIKNMTRYMLICRNKDLASMVREGVDTLLMYLYRALNLVDDMEKLASSPNSCVVEELENFLDDSGHLRTLAFLYASKGMGSKALAIWHILARNYSSGLWNDPTIVVQHGPLDDSTEIISCQRAAATEASKLLEESSDQGLVLQHLGWIGDEDQELAVKVLTSNKRANQLSPGEVLATIDPRKVKIRQRYLQWLIEDEDSEDTQLHTMYAISLAKSAIEAAEVNGDFEDSVDRIYDSDVKNGEASVNPIRERLQLFLRTSDLYDPEEVLYLIKDSDLWLEKAILYKKLGQETWVLQILALKLEDSEAAEQYCAEIGRHDAYMQLLDMYLDPQNGKKPMLNAAVRLLHNHGESLDPLQVLEKLSSDMPLQLASDTILRILRARVHHYHQGQVICNLSCAISHEAQMARMEERSRHVQINDESICSSCHTRLGTKLLAMYPDDSVVCYKCYRRQGESTSASGRNFNQNIVFKTGWLVTRQL